MLLMTDLENTTKLLEEQSNLPSAGTGKLQPGASVCKATVSTHVLPM